MAARSSWKGFLQLSLVSIPVKAYTAANSAASSISLNQLHAECHSRIRYQKTCPIHGEVTQDEIVMGYEYAKGQYVVVDTDELEKLRTEGDKAVTIDSFVPATEIDPIYFSGKNYYLAPDGPAGQKAYGLLQQALVDGGLCGVARVVLHGREQLVTIRPLDKLISMSILSYDAEIKKPSAFDDEIVTAEYSAEEMKLTKTLVDATTAAAVDLTQYKDEYTAKLVKLIEAKVEGRELVAVPSEPMPVINLMEALRASVEKAQSAAGAKAPPAKKMAASTRDRKPAPRKKKSG
ncbi:MAG: Ku protein [Planctomycetes bacterium]|nr:Ku protein [Planctomycetota bacterium]